MSAFSDDPNLSDSSRRVIRRVMERRQRGAGDAGEAQPPLVPTRGRDAGERGGSAEREGEGANTGAARASRFSGQHAPPPPPPPPPLEVRQRRGQQQQQQQPEADQRREEIRRNLNDLRAEVYGRPADPHHEQPTRLGVTPRSRHAAHAHRDPDPSAVGASPATVPPGAVPAAVASHAARREWERRPAGVPSARRAEPDGDSPVYRPQRRQLSPPHETRDAGEGDEHWGDPPELAGAYGGGHATRFSPVRSRADPPNATPQEMFEQRVRTQDQQIRRLSEELALMRNELRETREAHRDDVARQRQAALDGQQEGVARLADEVRQLAATTKGLQRQLDTLSTDLQELKAASGAAEGMAREAQDRLHLVDDEIAFSRRAADKMAQDLHAARGELSDLRRDADRGVALRQDMKHLRSELAQVQGELTQTRRHLEKELRGIRDSVAPRSVRASSSHHQQQHPSASPSASRQHHNDTNPGAAAAAADAADAATGHARSEDARAQSGSPIRRERSAGRATGRLVSPKDRRSSSSGEVDRHSDGHSDGHGEHHPQRSSQLWYSRRRVVSEPSNDELRSDHGEADDPAGYRSDPPQQQQQQRHAAPLYQQQRLHYSQHDELHRDVPQRFYNDGAGDEPSFVRDHRDTESLVMRALGSNATPSAQRRHLATPSDGYSRSSSVTSDGGAGGHHHYHHQHYHQQQHSHAHSRSSVRATPVTHVSLRR